MKTQQRFYCRTGSEVEIEFILNKIAANTAIDSINAVIGPNGLITVIVETEIQTEN